MYHISTHNRLWLTVPIAILLAVAAGCGLLVDGLYRDVPSMVTQAKAQDIVSLGVVLPILMITAVLTLRGSLRARLIWLGALVYLVYTYASFAFAIRYNPLFIAYIALLGCSLYALIINLATIDYAEMKARFASRLPAKVVCLFFVLIVILFYYFWLSELIPALIAGRIPQSILDDGTPTNAIHVLDMAWILPSFGIAAVSLWRKGSLGYTLAGILLPFFVLLVSAVLSMGLLVVWEGDPEAFPMVVMFGALLVIAIGMVIWYLKGLHLPQGVKNAAAASTGK